MRSLCLLPLVLIFVDAASAAVIQVPQDHATLQAAIDASAPGDTILVAPGTYPERIQLRSGISLRSVGDDTHGTTGLQRAETTIIDGGGAIDDRPGVSMAEGCTLDGFTVTNVGAYDGDEWQRHFDSHGEDLGDDEGSLQSEGTVPAVSIRGVSSNVVNCIVHHNGDVGIGILGASASPPAPLVAHNVVFRNMGGGIGAAAGAELVIRDNICAENLRAGIGCREANPIIIANVCRGNVRAGIGCREGARPIIRANTCTQNRRAGIGIRMEGTSPVVEANTCEDNEMAGIGCRDWATPILRDNTLRRNKLAGIGCRDGAQPTIVDNEIRENEQAGIGLQDGTVAVILRNRLLDNSLVAIGVTGGSTATIIDNELVRTAGVPPLIAVKDGSTATIRGNQLKGGGVAAVLVQGTATISGNTFAAANPDQGNGAWVWEGSTATIAGNTFDGYRSAVLSTKATVVVTENLIERFAATAIIVKDSPQPAHVYGNTGASGESSVQLVEIVGPAGIVDANRLE